MKDLIERIEAICSELGFRVIDREESEELYQSSLLQNDEICGSLFVEKDSNFLEIAYTYTFDVEEENFLKSHLESMMNICYEYGDYFNIMKGEDEINFSIFCWHLSTCATTNLTEVEPMSKAALFSKQSDPSACNEMNKKEKMKN